jgi:hypothetical protein
VHPYERIPSHSGDPLVAVIVFSVFLVFVLILVYVSKRYARKAAIVSEPYQRKHYPVTSRRRSPEPGPVRMLRPLSRIGCDRCGMSRVTGSRHMHISHARFEIKTEAGSIFLCGHHFRKHRAHIQERAYETVEQ